MIVALCLCVSRADVEGHRRHHRVRQAAEGSTQAAFLLLRFCASSTTCCGSSLSRDCLGAFII